jgi:hypothetical protein
MTRSFGASCSAHWRSRGHDVMPRAFVESVVECASFTWFEGARLRPHLSIGRPRSVHSDNLEPCNQPISKARPRPVLRHPAAHSIISHRVVDFQRSADCIPSVLSRHAVARLGTACADRPVVLLYPVRGSRARPSGYSQHRPAALTSLSKNTQRDEQTEQPLPPPARGPAGQPAGRAAPFHPGGGRPAAGGQDHAGAAGGGDARRAGALRECG